MMEVTMGFLAAGLLLTLVFNLMGIGPTYEEPSSEVQTQAEMVGKTTNQNGDRYWVTNDEDMTHDQKDNYAGTGVRSD